MKKNRRIVSLLAGAAVIISMITPLSKGYAAERTGTYDLKTVNISNVRAMDDLTQLLGDSEIDILTNLIDFNIKENYNGSAYEIAIDPTELSLVDSGKYGSNGDYEYYSKVRDFYMSLLSKCGYSEVDSKKMIDDLFKFENSIAGSILSYDTDESQIDKSQYNILEKEMLKIYGRKRILINIKKKHCI